MKRALLFVVFPLIFLQGCSSWSVSDRLNDVESYIMERPDSALAVLDTMDRTRLKSDYLKAHHALLHAMALDKNYIDVDDDSLASIAVKYFSKKGPDKYYARSLYYLGLSYYYAKDYKNAILEFTKAEKVAERNDSLYWAFLKVAQADTYSKCHNFEESIECLKQSSELYSQLGLHYYYRVSELRLSQTLFNQEIYPESEKILKTLIETGEIEDIVGLSAKVTYALYHALVKQDFNISVKYYDEIVNSSNSDMVMSFKDYWAYAYSLNNVGRKEESKGIINQLKHIDTSGTADYWMYRIEKSNGNLDEALKCLEKSTTKIDKEVMKALQQSLALSQRDYYEAEFENAEYKARNRSLISISIGIASVLILVLVFWSTSAYKRRLREEKEYYLNYADEIRRQLEDSKNDDYPLLKRKYLEISKSKFEMIASLYEEYVLHQGKKNAEHIVYSKVSEIINTFISDNANQKQLESVLDESLDGIVSMFRNEMPRLKEVDYSVFCYMIIGFDATTISHLLNISANVVYIRKSRMKQHIEDANPEHKSIFLDALR